MTEIPALTVMQPYGSGIIAGVKSVENRNWPPPKSLIGKRLLIHAGLSREYLDHKPHILAKVRRTWVGMPRDFVLGAIIGHVRVRGFVGLRQRPVACPWSFGPLCWELEDPVAIDPIPYTGALRIFYVPASALPAEVARAVAA